MASETTVAVVGLGVMGAPMAKNLVRAGYGVIGYNRTPAKAEALAAHGVRPVTTLREAVENSDVIITNLPDSPDVEAVVTAPDGVLAHGRRGALWIDMSTIRPDVARDLAVQAAERGIEALDAPVSGGERGAIEATLSVMVGGEVAAFERARPVLDALGRTVVHVGPSGAGQTTKAANQLIVAGTIQLVAEALVFLRAHGVDTDAAVPVLGGGRASSRILAQDAGRMLSHDFTPGFRVDLHHKDLGIVTNAAREAGVAIPLGSVVAQLMGTLRAQGSGDLDSTALMALTEALSGRES